MCKWTMGFHEITEAVIPVLVTLRELVTIEFHPICFSTVSLWFLRAISEGTF